MLGAAEAGTLWPCRRAAERHAATWSRFCNSGASCMSCLPTSRSWRSTLTACLLSACAGCAPADGAGSAGAGAPLLRVVLGTGEAEFEPMEGEPQLHRVAGVQGGFHAWASLLAYNFSAERPEMVLERGGRRRPGVLAGHARALVAARDD